MQPFFKDFSRTTLDFQGSPTRNITSAHPPPLYFFFSHWNLCLLCNLHVVLPMVIIYLAQTECIIVYQTDHYFIPLLACSAGVFIGHANGFARESAMLKLPERGGNGASHVHLDQCICTTLIIYIMVLHQTWSHSFIRSWNVELLSFFPLKKVIGKCNPWLHLNAQ